MSEDLPSRGRQGQQKSGPRPLTGVEDYRSRIKSRRPKYSRNQIRAAQYFRASLVLGTLLLISLIGWSVTGYKLSAAKSQFVEYQVSTRQTLLDSRDFDSKTSVLETEVKALRDEMAILVEQRIPRLSPLEFDVNFPLAIKYVKNISFTRTGTATEKKYEYRTVLENKLSYHVLPDVSILLFDKLGIQVGMAELTKNDSTSAVRQIELQSGESRSYSSQITLSRSAEPEYFLVEVR